VCRASLSDLFLRTTAIPNRDKRLMTTEQSPKIGALSLDRRGIFSIAAGGALAALLSACSLPPRGIAVPIGHSTKASVLGLPNERFFPLSGTEPLEAEFAAAADRRRQALGLESDARHYPKCSFWQFLAGRKWRIRRGALRWAGRLAANRYRDEPASRILHPHLACRPTGGRRLRGGFGNLGRTHALEGPSPLA
jgi:hypothetical protein